MRPSHNRTQQNIPTLRVLQINAARSATVMAELREVVSRERLDILFLQEPYNHMHAVRGLGLRAMVCGHHTDPWAVIVICNPLLTVTKMSQYTHAEAATVSLLLDEHTELTLVSFYSRHGRPISEDIVFLDGVIRTHSRAIICMDANAQSDLWHSAYANDRGRELAEFITRSDLVVHNRPDHRGTYVTANTNLDLTLTTRNISAWLRHWELGDDLTSDHRPIRFEIAIPLADEPSAGRWREVSRKCGFATRNARWEVFREVLRTKLLALRMQDCPRADCIDGAVREFIDAVTATCRRVLRPRRVFNTRSSAPWWSRDLAREKANTLRARNVFQRASGERRQELQLRYREQLRRYKRLLRQEKDRSWRNLVLGDIGAEPWGLLYKLSAHKIRERVPLVTVRTAGGHTEGWADTATCLLSRLLPDDVDGVPETEYHLRVRAMMADLPAEMMERDEDPFDMDDLVTALESLKLNRAPGPDLIPPEVYAQASDVILPRLLDIYNNCLEHGYFPRQWKIGTGRILFKGGARPPDEAGSYRMIQMLDVAGKLLEKLMLSRLQKIAPHHRRQYGFVKGGSTVEALRDIVRHWDTRRKYVLLIFIDIKGAFDHLWWPGVLQALRQRPVSGRMFAMVRSFLNTRETLLVSNERTVRKTPTRGCPQGSVLGPFLWNLVADILLDRLNTEATSLVMYADDGTIIIESDSRAALEETANRALADTMNWCAEQRLEISADKTRMMLLKGRRARFLNAHRLPRVLVNNTPIPRVTTHKVLGVVLDSALSFRAHIETIAERAIPIFRTLNRLARHQWGISTHTRRVTYAGVAEALMCYAAPVWWKTLTSANRTQQMLKIQRAILLAVTRAYASVSTEALPVLAGVLPADLLVWRRAMRYYVKKGELDAVTPYIGVNVDNPLRRVDDYILSSWQDRWTSSPNGRRTYQYWPNIRMRMRAANLFEVDAYSAQFVSGHGDFRANLVRFRLSEDAICECGQEDTPDHVLNDCPDYEEERQKFLSTLARQGIYHLPTPAEVAQHSVIWNNFKSYARDILLHRRTRRHIDRH